MVITQLQLFLIFIINGIIIGLLFDFFRILRKAINTPDIITYIEDLLFWTLTGGLILYLIFTYNNGEIRLFMFIAIFIGVIFYMLLISKLIMNVSLTIINFIKKIIITILNIIKIPINILIKLIKKLVLKPGAIIIINIRKNIKKLEEIPRKLKMSTKFTKKVKN